jgi:dTDP-4-amino-4,6-dideoxygalactose transaminase
MKVPFVDLTAGYLAHQQEIDAAIVDVIARSDFVLGDRVEAFERSFAAFCGVPYAIGCGNGTDALELALEASGIGPGDEVITVSHTFAATVEAILRVGATAVLVDVDRESMLIDPAAVANAVGPSTAAIVAVHLYGAVAPMDDIASIARAHDLLLVEDAAQAHGATWRGDRVGDIGDVAAFSFYPTKNLGAFGDAGMVVTRDHHIAARTALIRDHGKKQKFVHEIVGRNSRLDGIQAAILGVKLRHLDEENDARREAQRHYARGIVDRRLPARVPTVPAACEAVYHLAVIEVNERDRVRADLEAAGIVTGVHYPVPVHRHPAFSESKLVRIAGALEATDEICDRIVSLPLWPQIRDEQLDTVLDQLAVAIS